MKMKLDAEDLNLIELAQNYSDEAKARELLESLLWPNGPVCPHCKCDDVYKLTPKPTPATDTRVKPRKVRQGLYCCAACRKQFTVTVGTVMEASHIPITKWVMAMFILCSSKKSISAHQLHRMLKIGYQAAWFMAHRIRFAMGPNNAKVAKLKGTVEVDETFIGGKGEMRTKVIRKTPVVALIERGGNMRTAVVSNVTQKNLRAVINECVDNSAVINTDDSGVYRRQRNAFADHHIVNHSAKQYVLRQPDGCLAHVNSCESFFGLFKRGVQGSWHHVSREHLPKYAGEFAFRWNHRNITDGERFVKGVESVEGKRLTYRQAV
ncbi:MAG: IS1595 family transposase [Verrucomicrobiota bacterium]|jgi:transposase-like protein